ncbi:winged helix-turn-helix transcriptional regulator [Novosphingobium sp. YJ-S2-02]|uniref:Winged helix-turn-helix transcriptional regulator n=2 Tax=Novosphingobium aureum TaxID=2792964 RepID=A0A931H9Y2_9SPHN|nr:winged helix-turn-helix transcriptional regulator [Novosphingobium aureum]
MAQHVDELLAVLAELTRLRALQIVWVGDEHSVCDLMGRLDVTQSRMSRHMQRLKKAGLVVDRRDGQWVRYRKCTALPDGWVAIIERVLDTLPTCSEALDHKKAA